MNRSLFIMLLLLPFLHACSTAQRPGEYTSSDKKAIKHLESAVAVYQDMDPYTGKIDLDKALEYVNMAIERDDQFCEAYMLKSQIYNDKGDIETAADNMGMAVQVNPEYSRSNIYFLADLEMKCGRYESCLRHAKQYLNFPQHITSPQFQEKARKMVIDCQFAVEAIKNPVPFDPKNVGPDVNTKYPEYFPTITGDDQTLLFTRLLPDREAYGGVQEDFFYSNKVDGRWTNGESISNRINTIYNEGAPSLSADGQMLIFAACALIDGYGANRQGYGSCDLFVTMRDGNDWMVAKNLGVPLNTSNWETQPSFSADGRTLYFIQGKTHVNGRSVAQPHDPNIFVTRLQEDGSWSKPEKLPDHINTPGNEASVLIHPDGQTLYFASDGHPGMGGLDLYVTRKQPDGSWGKPENLGYPINTFNDENSLLVSGDGEVAFFASDREGGYGELDIYSFSMPEHLKPVGTTYMKGIVYDIIDKSKLGAAFELIDLETNEVIVRSYSNWESGEFILNIPKNHDYALNVSKDGYLFYSKNFSLSGEASKDDPFLMDVPLTPISDVATNNGIVLENVFFDVDSYDLKPASRTELDKLYGFLKDNPNIKIELSGHTDSDGDDAHNKTLSDNRAKAVKNYLVDKGISADRITAIGFGEEKPIVANDTPENKAKNRRTEYKILSY